MAAPAPATTCSRARSSTIIEQEKLAPVRFQVVNKPGGDSTTAAAYVVSKKGDPHVIACFTNIWIDRPAGAAGGGQPRFTT